MDLDADNPNLKTFRRRLRDSKGLHVVMVADEETTQGRGSVYGLFECHQPPPSSPRTRQSPLPIQATLEAPASIGQAAPTRPEEATRWTRWRPGAGVPERIGGRDSGMVSWDV